VKVTDARRAAAGVFNWLSAWREAHTATSSLYQ